MRENNFLYGNILLLFLLSFLGACSNPNDEILPGKRENIFSYDVCKECYSSDVKNKKINLKKFSGENDKLLNDDFSFEQVDTFSIGEISERRTGTSFVITPVVENGLLYTLDSEFYLKIYSFGDEGFVLKRDVLDSNELLENEIPVGFVVNNKIVFITTSVGRLIAYDTSKKEILWKNELEGKIFKSAPSVSRKYVFVLTSDNILFAFRKVGGSQEFKHKGLPVLTSADQGAVVQLDSNENIVVPFSNGEVHYLTSKGRFLFATNVKNYRGVKTANLLMDIVEKPIVDGDKLIVAGMANVLKVVSLRSGKKLWEKDIRVKFLPVVKYGYIFVQDDENNVFAFGEDSSKLYWKVELPKDEDGELIEWLGPVEDNGKLVFSSEIGDVLILDLKTGKQIFRDGIRSEEQIVKPIIYKDNLIFVNGDGRVRILR